MLSCHRLNPVLIARGSTGKLVSQVGFRGHPTPLLSLQGRAGLRLLRGHGNDRVGQVKRAGGQRVAGFTTRVRLKARPAKNAPMATENPISRATAESINPAGQQQYRPGLGRQAAEPSGGSSFQELQERHAARGEQHQLHGQRLQRRRRHHVRINRRIDANAAREDARARALAAAGSCQRTTHVVTRRFDRRGTGGS